MRVSCELNDSLHSRQDCGGRRSICLVKDCEAAESMWERGDDSGMFGVTWL